MQGFLKTILLMFCSYDDDFYAILRSVQEEKETENAKKSRSKRSAPQPFDWHSVGGPSKFLEKHNVGYRIKVKSVHTLKYIYGYYDDLVRQLPS